MSKLAVEMGKCGCMNLIKSIDAYIAKVDNDLASLLEDEGFEDSEHSVDAASELEEDIVSVLEDQTEEILEVLIASGSLNAARNRITQLFASDKNTKATLEDIFAGYYEQEASVLAGDYIKQSDGELVINELRRRTTAWIEDWSIELANLMNLTSETQMGNLIEDAISEGKSVTDLTRSIMENGIRNEEYRARRTALTEMLRCHSVAQQEAMIQSPACKGKKWRHTGAYKNTPRPNHVAMDGQIVAIDKPFTLIGIKGGTLKPMYPRDSNLPAEEVINCHCLAQPVADEDVLGMNLEERQKLQQEIIDNDNGEWEQELDARNKTRAGIEEEVEAESSKPKYPYSQTVINRKAIASADYRKKYDNLPETKKVRRKIAAEARSMLRHRSGTRYEDLAFIDSKSGEVLTQTNGRIESKVSPTRAMKKMLKKVDDYSVIGIHNHPVSSTPSLDDIVVAVQRKYKYGIAVCHNGTVFKYTINGKVNHMNVDIYLAKINALIYNGDTDGIKQAIKELSKNGVDLEVF